MANRAEHSFPRRNSSFRVGDGYIWTEIHYLDSATDYRECLPERSLRSAPKVADDLVMLDSSAVCWPGVVGILLGMVVGIAGVAWLAYLAASGV